MLQVFKKAWWASGQICTLKSKEQFHSLAGNRTMVVQLLARRQRSKQSQLLEWNTNAKNSSSRTGHRPYYEFLHLISRTWPVSFLVISNPSSLVFSDQTVPSGTWIDSLRILVPVDDVWTQRKSTLWFRNADRQEQCLHKNTVPWSAPSKHADPWTLDTKPYLTCTTSEGKEKAFGSV
jgi:hypothetical protein